MQGLFGEREECEEPTPARRSQKALSDAPADEGKGECEPGTRFGDYRLLGEIARGGMGIVYRAEHSGLRRIVALKIIAMATRLSESAEQRFRAEAELIATLDHPNIVPVYDVGQVNGRPFYTMKYIEGEDLGVQLKAGHWQLGGKAPNLEISDTSSSHPASLLRRPGAKAAWLVATVSRAVHHAHERGILHRDLKPSNILIDREGRPYVTDFGLAKRMDAELGITLSGDLLGTPAYMPPEQARCDIHQLTTAADVYSLGAILYHLLANQPPFDGASPVQIIKKVVDEEPIPPRNLDPRVDSDLSTICLKCLEKNSKRRYTSALELAEDLERWLRNEPILARPASRTEHLRKWAYRHPAWATAIAVTCAAGISIIGLLTGSRQKFKGLAQAAQENAEQQRVLREQAEAAKASLSDHLLRLRVQAAEQSFDRGDSLAGIARLAQLVREHPGEPALVRRLIGAVSTRQVARTHDSLYVGPDLKLMECSGDGRFLAVASADGTVRVWDVQTMKLAGPPFRHDSDITALVFSPEGDRLVTRSARPLARQEVRIWNVTTGTLAMEPVQCRLGPVAFLRFPTRLVVVEHETPIPELAGEVLCNYLRIFDLEAQPPKEIPFDVVAARIGDFDVKPLGVSEWQAGVRQWKIESDVQALAAHPSRDYVVAISFWGVVHIMDPDTRRRVFPGIQKRIVVNRIVFEPNGDGFIIAGDKPEALIFSLASGQLVDRLVHEDDVTDTDWSADGEVIATGAVDGTVRLWRGKNGFRLSGELAAGGPVTMVRFLNGSSRLLTVSTNGSARVWNVGTRQPVLERIRWQDHFVASPTQQWAASATDGTVHFWRLDQGSEPDYTELFNVFPKTRDIVFSPSGRIVVTVTASASATEWNIEDGHHVGSTNPARRIRSIQFHSNENHYLLTGDLSVNLRIFTEGTAGLKPVFRDQSVFAGFVNDETQFLGVAANGQMHLWNLADRQLVSPGPDDLGVRVNHAEMDSTREHLLICGPDGAAAVRAWKSNTEVAALRTGWSDDIVRGQFSPDDRYLFLLSENGRVAVFEWRVGAPVRTAVLQRLNGAAAGFSPDSSRLLVRTDGGQVLIVSLNDPVEEPVSLAGSDFVDARFGPDGRQVITAGRDRAARIWDAETGLPVWSPIRHSSPLYSAAIGPSGSNLITGGFEHAYLWKLPVFELPGSAPEWLPTFAEAIAGQRLEGENRIEDLSEPEVAKIFQATRHREGADWYTLWAKWVLDRGAKPW